MTASHRHLASAVLLATVLVTGACAIQHDAQPRAIDRSQVPFSLLATSTTSAEPATPMRAEVPTSIFLIDSNTEMLTEVLRPVPPPPSVRAGLLELLLGPTEEELARGLNSAITRSTTLLGVDGPRDGVVTVDLSDDLRSIGGQGQRLALAQVVFTATATPEVSAVRFAFEGQPSAVPDGQGASTTEPLDRTDFATFDPRAPLPPPAASPPPSEAPPSSG